MRCTFAASRRKPPVGAEAPGPAMPGEAYEVRFDAADGDRLSFVTMFGMSSDWFFAAPNTGPPDPDDRVRAADYAVPAHRHLRVTLVAH